MKSASKLILIIMISFSARAEDPFESSVPQVTFLSFDHPNSGMAYSSDYGDDPRKLYRESLSAARINKDPALSCYENSESTNYVNLSETIISQLRLYASDQHFEITHRSSSFKSGEIFKSLSFEEKKGQFSVRKRICFKSLNGITLKVISELYERNEYE